MLIREVIEKIEAYHPHLEGYDGCDGVKSGNPDVECTGVVAAIVPTMEVIEKCIELGCNFLYVHEPSYYMTADYPEWRGDFANEVYEN
jgi:putative NIF3 family GTP cyclohydrolase 1 type 2